MSTLRETEVPALLDLTEGQYRDFVRAGRLYLYRHGVRELADCEDLLHDSIVKALRGWKPDRGTTLPSFFIHVVLRNEMLNWFRSRKTHLATELSENTPGAPARLEADILRKQTARKISAYRAGLSAPDRELLDCAVLLLGSLGTSRTKRGEPHNFAAQGAQRMGTTRHLFLAAWDRIRSDLKRLIGEVADGGDD